MPRKGKSQPIKAAPGQPYGDAKAQKDAQREIPLPNTSVESEVPLGPVRGSGGMERAVEMARDYMSVADTPFASPTARPKQPVTHGLMSGPGGGPEVLAGARSRLSSQRRVMDSLQMALDSPRTRRLSRRAR